MACLVRLVKRRVVASDSYRLWSSKEASYHLHRHGCPISDMKQKVTSAKTYEGDVKLTFKQQDEGVFIYTEGLKDNKIDQIITLTVK